MPELEKAFLKVEGKGEIPCLYNPETLSLGRRNDWSGNPMPGKGVPTLRYSGARSGWMHLDLMFDTTSDGTPVTVHTGKIAGADGRRPGPARHRRDHQQRPAAHRDVPLG